MKRPRYIDFLCQFCGHKEERFVETNDDGSVIEEQRCNAIVPTTLHEDGEDPCGGLMEANEFGVGGYAQTINRSNSDFNERQRERLEKRSREHWDKVGKHEARAKQDALLKRYESQ